MRINVRFDFGDQLPDLNISVRTFKVWARPPVGGSRELEGRCSSRINLQVIFKQDFFFLLLSYGGGKKKWMTTLINSMWKLIKLQCKPINSLESCRRYCMY